MLFREIESKCAQH
ncbi:hypothetical protein D043_4456, partial [Vibrio parahaemolyticus EKP-021]